MCLTQGRHAVEARSLGPELEFKRLDLEAAKMGVLLPNEVFAKGPWDVDGIAQTAHSSCIVAHCAWGRDAAAIDWHGA